MGETEATHFIYSNCFGLGTLTFRASRQRQVDYIQTACPVCDPETGKRRVTYLLSPVNLQPEIMAGRLNTWPRQGKNPRCRHGNSSLPLPPQPTKAGFPCMVSMAWGNLV